MKIEELLEFIDYATVTVEDLTDSAELYEKINIIGEQQGELIEQQELNKLSQVGKKLGINNVKTLYRAYTKELNKLTQEFPQQTTLFKNQPIALKTTWNANENGIQKGAEIACRHPILITRCFSNIDTNDHKVELAYKQAGKWQTVIVDRETISSRPNIIKLARYGISVTSENASAMINYLQELLDINNIPITKSTSRLGWIKNDFMPYTSELVFDGEIEFKRLCESVQTKGDRSVWYDTVHKLRAKDPIYSLVIAASLVSPMLEILEALPAFIHIWSGIAASGKTVLAMIAASCWGNPRSGYYMQSFNATSVAMERLASTLNSLPLVIDELQLSRDNWGNQRFDVYKLAQGIGKGRGRKTGGIDQLTTWCNTIITTGETPIVAQNDGQGAFARVLEVEIEDIIITLDEGQKIVPIINNNYGWAGKEMIDILQKEDLQPRYIEAIKQLKIYKKDIQEKQLMIGAAILVADEIITEQLFYDDRNINGLSAHYLVQYLKTIDESSIEARAYHEIIDWITINKRKFEEDSMTDYYGFIENGIVYIVRSAFNDFVESRGFSARSVLSLLANNGLIETYKEPGTGKNRFSISVMRDGHKANYVHLKLNKEQQTRLKGI